MILSKKQRYEILADKIVSYIKDELDNVIDAKLVEKEMHNRAEYSIPIQMYLDERINRIYIRLEIDPFTRHTKDPKLVYTRICSRIINCFPAEHSLHPFIIGPAQAAIINRTLAGMKESSNITINTVGIWEDYNGVYHFIDNESQGLILRGDIGVNSESEQNMKRYMQYISKIKEINEKYDYVNNNKTDCLLAFEELKQVCLDLYGENIIEFEESEIKRFYIDVLHFKEEEDE